jgi:hypothetical protein
MEDRGIGNRIAISRNVISTGYVDGNNNIVEIEETPHASSTLRLMISGNRNII